MGIPESSRSAGWTRMPSLVAGPAVRVIDVEVAPGRPGEENARVRLPTSPEIERSVKLATPAASVFTVAVPPRVPPPLAMATVTGTPLFATAVPAASRSWSTGWGESCDPLAAVAPGWVVILSWLGGAAVTAIAAEVTEARPEPLN